MRINPLFILLYALSLIVGIGVSNAQQSTTLEIIRADLLKGESGVQRLTGDVEMKHQNTLIYCDSALFYKEQNNAKLFGNVRIVDQNDPVQTKSAYAEYDGNTKIAKLRSNVVFTNQETTLYTEYLNFDRVANVANYFNGGRVIDSVNVLTSELGRYELNLERITFQQEVVLVNPDYTMKTNDLVYLTIPKTAETKGLTNLVSKDGNTLDAQNGSFYNTQERKFRFFNGIVENETSRIKADELFYSELESYYLGKENVSVFNKERQVEVFGDVGEYWEGEKHSVVHGNALVRRYFEKDTLYMTADTLISRDNDEDSVKYMLAFRSIKLINKDMTGISDSLVYNYSDSTIQLFGDPVMWNLKSQVTADSMTFFIANEEIDRMEMKANAFVITQDTINNFNQMKGRNMFGDFVEGKMSQLTIEGNGESLYFALEADTLTQGINKTLSANIKMKFTDGVIKRVAYGVKPDGKFTPFQLISEKDRRLEGFVWRLEEKPNLSDIHEWRLVDEVDPDAENLFNLPDVKLRMPTDEEIDKSLKKRGWKP